MPSPHTDVHDRTIDVIQEQVDLRKEEVVTGKVTVHKEVHETEVPIQGTLWSNTVEVTRVPIDQYVDTAPTTRQEGDITIIPVMKEVMVKRYLLVEEVHIKRQKTSTHYADTTTVRREEVVVRREDYTDGAAASAGPLTSEE